MQDAFAGAPVQANETDPVNPGPGVNCKLKTAVWPAVIVAEVEPEGPAEIPNAGLAVPVTEMACGEFGASSVMTIEAVRGPALSGANVTFMLQLEFTG